VQSSSQIITTNKPTPILCKADKYKHNKTSSLSVLTAIFPGGPGLAGTRMSPFSILLELRVMEAVVTTGAIRRAKLQLNHHHQQTNTHLFYSPDAFPVAQPTMSSTE